MDFLNTFQALKASLAGDKTNPRERYIYIDGSPYGSQGLARFLMNPKVSFSTVPGLFVVAADVLLSSPAERTSKLMWGAAELLGGYGICYLMDLNRIRKDLPDFKDTVIDKTGRAVNDPKASARLQCWFKTQFIKNAFIAPPVVLGMGWATGSRSLLGLVVYNAVDAAYSIRAVRKLSRKEWTIQTKPPELRDKVENKVVGSAVIPARFSLRGFSIRRSMAPPSA